MFIRVVSSGPEVDSLYECESVHFLTISNEIIRVIMEGPKVELNLEKRSFVVYVMNNQGKTIDTYRWDIPDTGS